MKKAFLLLAVAIPAAVIFSCNRQHVPEPKGGGTVYLDLPDSVYGFIDRTGQMPDSFNNQATLGRVLFYDRHLSLNNSVSCGTCHKQAFAFSDNVALSAGFENRLTSRNTPPLQNLSGFSFGGGVQGPFGPGFSGGGRLFWDGRENDLRKLIMKPVANHVEMGMDDPAAVITKLNELPYYKSLFLNAFGSETITIDRISTAVALFVGSINAVNTRFDQANTGGKLSALELEGMQLFHQKYDCEGCHNENIHGYFSGAFNNIGLDAPYKDNGVGAVSGNSADNGRFKVPNLRNVALTAPYMHDGRFKTLNDVLDHYSHGIKGDTNLDTLMKDPKTGGPLRMNINAHEKTAIIAFLGTLTDVDMITNPNFSDPFKIK